MVVSEGKWTQYMILLLMGTPKKVPLILGDSHMFVFFAAG